MRPPDSCSCQVVVPWFLNNVARNSPARISDFEIASLELQRLWAMSKNDRVKLRATFGGLGEVWARARPSSWPRLRPSLRLRPSSRPRPPSRPSSRPRGSSTMSHVIPLCVFQTLKSHRWNCNVCGLCPKMTVLNYVRLFWGKRRKGAEHRQRGRAHNVHPAGGRIRSPSPRPRCPRPRPSRRTSRNPRRSRGSRPRSGSGPPGSPGSRRSRRAGTGPRTPGS